MLDEPAYEYEPDTDALPCGATLLRGQYMIDSYLVRGGFGVTYLAVDSLERQVVIKECFPQTLACRVGDEVRPVSEERTRQFDSIRRHFLREARRLARLEHPNIVGVHQVFEENNTAYMALDYVGGDDLLTVLEDTPDRLTPALVRHSLDVALESVSYIHGKGILHRDISPDNFLIEPNNKLTLIDFGAAREKAGRESRSLSALLAVKDGYSPHEFYMADVEQFACSDLYSLGATFFHLITGQAPPNSQDRLAALAANSPDPYQPLVDRAHGYDRAFLATIDRSLSVLPKDRMQSAEEWQAELAGEDNSVTPEQVAVFLGNDLRREISQLVEDTNRAVTQGRPGDMRNARKIGRSSPKAADEAKARPRQPVDIFGEPIEDIDAWLRDQDRKAQQRANAGALPPEPNDTWPEMPEPIQTLRESSTQPRRGWNLRRGLTALRGGRGQAV